MWLLLNMQLVIKCHAVRTQWRIYTLHAHICRLEINWTATTCSPSSTKCIWLRLENHRQTPTRSKLSLYYLISQLDQSNPTICRKKPGGLIVLFFVWFIGFNSTLSRSQTRAVCVCSPFEQYHSVFWLIASRPWLTVCVKCVEWANNEKEKTHAHTHKKECD